jgi:hypothetical protein
VFVSVFVFNQIYISSFLPISTRINSLPALENLSTATSTTQTDYGIKEDYLDITGFDNTNATIAADSGEKFLLNSLRARTLDFQLGDEEMRPNSLSFSIWGYYTTLQWRHYERAFKTAVDVGTIVSTALAYSKSSASSHAYGGIAPFISSDRSNIQTIGRSITHNQSGKPVILQDYIQGAIAGGDSNGKQLFFQILADRKPYLFPRAAAARYYVNYNDPRIYDSDHKLIPPYMVRAGGFILSETLNDTFDPINDVFQRARASYVSRTVYDDLTGKLTIPQPDTLATPERIIARTSRQFRRTSLIN